MEFSTPESHVHLGLPALLEFRRGRADDEPLVLATVIATEGSTYRKPGAMMLIAGDGAFAGLISGGCLEGDLAQHAQAVFASGEPAQLTYDMSAGDDLVWNLGLGCDGVIHLLLQRLERDEGLAVFEQVDRAHRERKAVLLAVATDPATAPRGALGLVDADQDSAALDQPRLDGTRHGLAAAGDVELAVDTLEMGVDGVGGDAELLGDLLALQPVGEQLDDVELAVGQVLERASLADGGRSNRSRDLVSRTDRGRGLPGGDRALVPERREHAVDERQRGHHLRRGHTAGHRRHRRDPRFRPGGSRSSSSTRPSRPTSRWRCHLLAASA